MSSLEPIMRAATARPQPKGLVMVRSGANQRELRNLGTCGPNDRCPCGSGRKFKKCCQYKHCASQAEVAARALEPGTKAEIAPGQKLTPATVMASMVAARIEGDSQRGALGVGVEGPRSCGSGPKFAGQASEAVSATADDKPQHERADAAAAQGRAAQEAHQ